MNRKPLRPRRPSRALVAGICMLFLVVGIAADGPVNTVAGVTITGDTDSGSGEQWGRPGGRAITFTVGNTTALSTLFWGATSAPSAAFDNNVGDVGEVMTTLDASNFGLGIARWSGQARLPLASGATPMISTRFTLLVTTTNGMPVPLSTTAGGAVVGIDVKSVGVFTATLRFEAFDGLNWQPLLDYYDAQPTPQGNPPGSSGPVLTAFNSGFYFTNANTGMTVDQHDVNEIARFAALQGTANQIKDGTEFLRIEVPGRLAPLATDVSQIKNNVSSIQQLLQNPPPAQQIPADLARKSDVDNAKNNITDILMILIGLKPCPLPADQCGALTFMPQVARQTSVDQLQQQVTQQLTELRAAVDGIQGSIQVPGRLDLQVTEFTEPDSAHRRRWLLRTSVNGAPTPAELSGVIAIAVGKKKPTTATDVTSMAVATQLLPGLMEVVLDVSKPNLADLAFHFSVRHLDGASVLEASAVVGDTKK